MSEENAKTTFELFLTDTGFSILDRRGKEKPCYIEDIELVVQDILSDKAWTW